MFYNRNVYLDSYETMLFRCLIILWVSAISTGFIFYEPSTTLSTHANGAVTVSGIAQVPCKDDGDMNCAAADEYFHVCSDIDHAKTVCRLHCNLCSLVDGNWTEWSPWSDCHITCGDGHLTRTRTCTNPAPANLGSNCSGTDSEHKTCSLDPCPVHGGWSSWESWGTCSVSCGVGIQRRDRTCSNPPPQYFGDHCFGDSFDNRLCFPGHCRDGGWSSWASWSSCSGVPYGLKSRQRTCDNPAPSLLGSDCKGSPIQYDICGADAGKYVHTNTSCCVEYAAIQYDSDHNAHKVRLCDGDGQNSCNPRKGRVEVTRLDTMVWGTVCDFWTHQTNIDVFCRSIGYRSASGIPRIAGPSSMPINLYHRACVGNETNIFRCVHHPFLHDVCTHAIDLSVMCE